MRCICVIFVGNKITERFQLKKYIWKYISFKGFMTDFFFCKPEDDICSRNGKNGKFWQPSWILDHLGYSKVFIDARNEFLMEKYIVMKIFTHFHVFFHCHKLIF